MHYFAGWDVGGWNCENNPNSRDSLAVLATRDGTLSLEGKVFRGNIRRQINDHNTLGAILNVCCDTGILSSDSITVAIDTPLGMPKALVDLINTHAVHNEMPQSYSANPYLYRQTERWLFEKGFSPLSAIKDMIGSQATKGMHLLAKLGLKTSDGDCGVWRIGNVTAIETYPTPTMTSNVVKEKYAALKLPTLNHDDKIHAVFCALLAYIFVDQKDALIAPQEAPPNAEGWIWIPADAAR